MKGPLSMPIFIRSNNKDFVSDILVNARAALAGLVQFDIEDPRLYKMTEGSIQQAAVLILAWVISISKASISVVHPLVAVSTDVSLAAGHT